MRVFVQQLSFARKHRARRWQRGTRMKKSKYHMQRPQIRLAILFLIPWITGLILFSLYPIVSTIYYSFTEYNLMKPPVVTGLKNYMDIFQDKNFYQSVYNSQYGLVNSFLKALGIPQPLWLSSAQWSKPAAILMALWAVGNTIIVYLAGIGDIPTEYYEAIELDGGGPIAKFRYITWPMLSNVTFFQLINGIIVGFATFTQSYMVAAIEPKGNGLLGGVKNSLLFYAVNIYNEGFRYLKFGYASALAVIMLLGMILITVILFVTSKKWVYYGGGGRDE